MLGFELTLAGTRTAPQGQLVVDGEETALRRGVAARSAGARPRHGRPSGARQSRAIPGTARRTAAARRSAGRAARRWCSIRSALAIHLPTARRGRVPSRGRRRARRAVADLLPLGEDRHRRAFQRRCARRRNRGATRSRAAGSRSTDGRYESLVTGAVLSDVELRRWSATASGSCCEYFAASDGADGSARASGAVDLAAACRAGLDAHRRAQAFPRAEARRGERRRRAASDADGPGRGAARSRPRSPSTRPTSRCRSGCRNRSRPVAAVIDRQRHRHDALAAGARRVRRRWSRSRSTSRSIIPGQTFVRGRGLDSEWRGRVTHRAARRASADPHRPARNRCAARIDFIGKTFVVTTGTITFLGGKSIDPTIDHRDAARNRTTSPPSSPSPAPRRSRRSSSRRSRRCRATRSCRACCSAPA